MPHIYSFFRLPGPAEMGVATDRDIRRFVVGGFDFPLFSHSLETCPTTFHGLHSFNGPVTERSEMTELDEVGAWKAWPMWLRLCRRRWME